MITWSMIPYYLFSNFHCLGMCGPIAALVGRHPFWPFYLLGRVLGFSLTCSFFALFGQWVSWEGGFLRGLISFLGGIFLITYTLFSLSLPKFGKWTDPVQQLFASLFSKKSPWTAYLIGFATPLLPCGQSLLVYAFCALLEHPLAGFIQGLLFSLLTTPSLFLAIKGWHQLRKWKPLADPWMKGSVVTVGALSCLRGLAELELIPHYTLVPELHLTLW